MPSKRSPSQRTDEGRRGRQMAALSTGTNAGRLISAARRTQTTGQTSSDSNPTGGSQLHAFSNTDTLFVMTGTHRLYMEQAVTILTVRAAVGSAPSGASVIVDVRKNGVSIFTTSGHRPTIAAGSYTAAAPVVDVTSLDVGDYLTVDVVQVGSSSPGADLTVTVGVLS